jgi:hypothetical protein
VCLDIRALLLLAVFVRCLRADCLVLFKLFGPARRRLQRERTTAASQVVHGPMAAAALAVVVLHLTVLGQEGGAAQQMHCAPGALAVGLPPPSHTRVCERAARGARRGSDHARHLRPLRWRAAASGVRCSLTLRGGRPPSSGGVDLAEYDDNSLGSSRPGKRARTANAPPAGTIATDSDGTAGSPLRSDASAQERLDASLVAAVLDGNDVALPVLVAQGARVNAPAAMRYIVIIVIVIVIIIIIIIICIYL